MNPLGPQFKADSLSGLMLQWDESGPCRVKQGSIGWIRAPQIFAGGIRAPQDDSGTHRMNQGSTG